MNPFYELADLLEPFDVPVADTTKSATTFAKTFEGVPIQEARLSLLFKIRGCVDIAGQFDLSGVRSQQRVSFMNSLLERYSKILNTQDTKNFAAGLSLSESLETLRAYGDALEFRPESQNVGPLDRSSFASDIESLRASLAAEKLSEHASKFVDIALNSLYRILIEDRTYSDHEIRMRVKAIYADFCIQFDAHDAAFQSTAEKLYGLAKQYGGYGLGLLAIAADTTAVAGLLSAPI